MASFITAGNATNGLQVSSDNTGILQLKTGTGAGTTAITVDASQNATFAANQTVAGNLTLSGAGNIVLNTLNTYSTAANGYQKLPSGVIIQWGSQSTATGGTAVTWPIAFPTACLTVVGTSTSSAGIVQITPISTTGATMYSNVANIVRWIAIGY